MTVQTDIVAALTSLVAGRIYPNVGKQGGAKPYITYQQVGGVPVNFLAGIPDKRNGRFQFNAWADTDAAAATLIRQVEDAVRLSTTLRATTEGGAVGGYEPETKLHGYRQDFSIWFQA
jgi:hypothetical protein